MTFRKIFRGKSANTPGFLIAVLVAAGLLETMEGKSRVHQACDPSTFLDSVAELQNEAGNKPGGKPTAKAKPRAKAKAKAAPKDKAKTPRKPTAKTAKTPRKTTATSRKTK